MSESNYISIKGAKVNNLKNIDVTFHATSWSSSRDYPVPENHPWLLIHYTLKVSDAM